MAALQNIGAGNSNDAFYRYKMPRMITKIEGQGNGIRTNVVNMVDIAKALARPAAYITKYFGYDLGAQSKFDEKTGVSLVNGAHDTAKLAGLLENFIKKYVQCYGCGNPETEILITKTMMIQLKCAACGFISNVDMRDKLTKFILKNPLEQKKGSKDKKAIMRRAEKERLKEGEAADHEELLKKLTKKEVKKKGSTSISKDATLKATAFAKKKPFSAVEDNHSSSNGILTQADDENEAVTDDDDDDDDVQWHTNTSLEAVQQRIQEQLSVVTAEMVMLSTSETEKEKPKTTKKVVVGSRTACNGGTPEPEEKSGVKAVENGTTIAHSDEKLAEKIKMKLKGSSTVSQVQLFLGSLDGSPQEVMTALLDALFGGIVKRFSEEVTKKKNYLAIATQEEGSQILLLRAIESLCRKSSPEVVKEVALVLKILYDADVLEEEYMVQWYQEGLAGAEKNSQIWKNVKPFIEWLQNAESESESESE